MQTAAVPSCLKFLIALLLLQPLVHAQDSASLSGTVTDQSSAFISSATVTATNADTGLLRTTSTNSEGHYQFSSLPLGLYEIRVHKDGFSEGLRTGVHLVVTQSATVDISLRIGPASQQITVNADAALVDSSTANIYVVKNTGNILINTAGPLALPNNGSGANSSTVPGNTSSVTYTFPQGGVVLRVSIQGGSGNTGLCHLTIAG